MQNQSPLLFDRAALEAEWDAECAVKLAQAFLSDTQGLLEEIESGLERQDALLAGASAHKLAGCSKVIMCNLLADQSACLEKAAAAADWQRAANLLSDCLRPAYRNLCRQLKDYLVIA